MSLERLKITNHQALGKLVKKWALDEIPRPQSLEEFTDALVAAGVTNKTSVQTWLKSFEGSMTKFRMVQSTEKELIVRLPMKRMLEESMAALAAGGSYPFPSFYARDFFDGQPVVPIKNTAKMHEERIGDYTIAQCA